MDETTRGNQTCVLLLVADVLHLLIRGDRITPTRLGKYKRDIQKPTENKQANKKKKQ